LDPSANALAVEALYAESHCWQSDEWRDLKSRFVSLRLSELLLALTMRGRVWTDIETS
jgi:hypothetical protein